MDNKPMSPFTFCHYCKKRNRLYKKRYKSEDTDYKWLECAQYFESCSNEHCPFSIKIEVEHEFTVGLEVMKYDPVFVSMSNIFESLPNTII